MNWLLVRDPAAHDDFVAPARDRSELWRLLAGLVLISAIYLALSQTMFGTLFSLMTPEVADRFAVEINSGSTPLGMYVLLFQFGLLALATFFVVRAVHRRPVSSLFGRYPEFLRHFLKTLAIMVMMLAVVWALPPWTMGAPYEAGLHWIPWVLLLPISLLAVLVQAGTEEIFFRGYVQQQLAARFRSPFIWMVAPSVLFATGHYLPDAAGGNALPIALWAGVFGILMADLTARAGTLGPAIAVHFVNNVSALLIVSLPDDLSGLALYQSPFGIGDEEAMLRWLPVDFGLMIISWLAARLAIRR